MTFKGSNCSFVSQGRLVSELGISKVPLSTKHAHIPYTSIDLLPLLKKFFLIVSVAFLMAFLIQRIKDWFSQYNISHLNTTPSLPNDIKSHS